MDCLRTLLNTAAQSAPADQLSLKQAHLATAKMVSKHWGHERWLVPEGSPFGFKVITLHAGKRTSLQYHREKEEANLIIYGQGRLFLAEHVGAPMEEHALAPGHILHIHPGVVHRVEAVTDLVIVEVSTPELHDVIRIEDDMGRGNGRIEIEHAER